MVAVLPNTLFRFESGALLEIACKDTASEPTHNTDFF
jgi:hypothetical protein